MKKVLYIDSSAFTIKSELPTGDEKIESVFIEGYASTNDIDRARDVISAAVWEKGMENYLKNPVVLAYHDRRRPAGRMVEYKVDSKGLWVKVRVSAASEEVFNLVKDGVLTAFSVGISIEDAEYNSAAEVFLIKEVELIEISVVPIPCNQNTLFSLSKAFDTPEEYNLFKKEFIKADKEAKGLSETAADTQSRNIKEVNMTPEEIAKMLAEAAEKAATETANKLAAIAAEKANKEAAEKEAAAALEAKINAAVKTHVEVGASGAEKLLADITKAVEEKFNGQAEALKALSAEITAKAEELSAIQRGGKVAFGDKSAADATTYADREKAYLLSRIMGKSIESTKFGKQVIEKAGPHLPSNTWELEVSTNMEAEVRRRLVVAPLFRALAMQTNVMTIPINPEAGLATWITNAEFGTTASPGAAQTHTLGEITLNAYKVATLEYMNFEEEEDSLIILLPIVRDAMVRRCARAVDRAYLRGAGSGSDPVKGVALYDATAVVTPTNTGAASIANLRALRKDLGAWGLDPAEVVYVVSTEVYYDLLDDTAFQTMDKVGSSASLLTGQVGSIGNSPVLVSAEFPTKAGGAATAATNLGALAIAPGNFLAGNQRGLRFDTQDMVERQRKALVASLRTGLTQVTTNLGQGVSALRWS